MISLVELQRTKLVQPKSFRHVCYKALEKFAPHSAVLCACNINRYFFNNQQNLSSNSIIKPQDIGFNKWQRN